MHDKLLSNVITFKRLRLQIIRLPRVWKRLVLVIFDWLALSFSIWAGYVLRIGVSEFPITKLHLVLIVAGPIIATPIFIWMGLYRAVIRYLPDRAIWTILRALAIAVLMWSAFVFLLSLSGQVQFPRSIPFIYWGLGVIFVGSSRFVVKKLLLTESRVTIELPVIIYGAGEEGIQLAMSMRHSGCQPVVGFIDHDKTLQGSDVASVRVFPVSALPKLIDRFGVKEVIISNASLAAAHQQDIMAMVVNLGVKVRTLPSLADLLQGKYLVGQVREIDIEELLGRSSIPPNKDLLRKIVQGKTIMITGAGGSIGSELCRLIVRLSPQRLVLFEANEFALYRIEQELSIFKELSVIPLLGSVINDFAVRSAIKKYGVNVIFHTAAYKHVPMVEANAIEGIRNNVLGTKVVAHAALDNSVDNFVLISTDKAVRPANVMGATKRWAEIIVAHLAAEAAQKGLDQIFSAVRFGNVLGSNGSVVPLFKGQIERKVPVTLTDPEMTRYFMSIHEAAELIVQAGALSKGGDIFLLDMGEPIAIKDLAENMIKLAGFSVRDKDRPNGDIEIIVTGKRPGEKLFEELFYDASNAHPTHHPKILCAAQAYKGPKDIKLALDQLTNALDEYDEQKARRILFEFLSDVASSNQGPDETVQ